jgi:tetratricopeptide (TPR) repeat protein
LDCCSARSSTAIPRLGWHRDRPPGLALDIRDALKAFKAAGNAFFNLKQYDKAISDYTESIQLCHGSDFSKEDFSYKGRAAAYDAIGNYSQAKQGSKEGQGSKEQVLERVR